jgi:hypothetical protein
MTTSTIEPANMDALESEHKQWKSETSFDNDELMIYQKKLQELAYNNSREDSLKQIEHFQNQFIIQKEQLDSLKHEINIHMHRLAEFAKMNAGASEATLLPDHQQMHEKMETFTKLYAEMKKEFTHFLAK